MAKVCIAGVFAPPPESSAQDRVNALLILSENKTGSELNINKYWTLITKFGTTLYLTFIILI